MDIAAQTEGALDNLSELLARTGADLSHLVDVTVSSALSRLLCCLFCFTMICDVDDDDDDNFPSFWHLFTGANNQVYLTDMALFPAYSAVFNAYFDAATGPTCTTVAVKALAHPHQLIEIKAMAVAATGSAAAASAGAAPATFAVDV